MHGEASVPQHHNLAAGGNSDHTAHVSVGAGGGGAAMGALWVSLCELPPWSGTSEKRQPASESRNQCGQPAVSEASAEEERKGTAVLLPSFV